MSLFSTAQSGVLTASSPLAVGVVVAAQDAAAGISHVMSDVDVARHRHAAFATPMPPRRARAPYPTDRSSRSSGAAVSARQHHREVQAGTAPAAQRAMLARAGTSTHGRAAPYADFDIVTIDDGADPEAAAARARAQPDVEYAQARYRVHPMFVPNDPLYPQQWNFPAIDMERAWDMNPGASSSA